MVNHDLLENLPENSSGLTIGEAYPNPFTESVTIPCRVAQRGPLRIDILDIRGSVLRTLRTGIQEAGNHSIVWDGNDNQGNRAEAGVYMVRFTGGNTCSVKRVILLK
jgi:flagellar hook assembly protein FlgD